MLDSEAQDNAESEANEVQQLRLTLSRYDEERKLLLDEISQLKEMLKREVDQAENDKKNNMTIINDYKLVRQRLDTQLHVVWTKLDDLKYKVSNCENCKHILEETKIKEEINEKGSERVRELELELAQTKLAQVEAECKNQDLVHRLRNTEIELTSAKNSWPPWLSKTLSSIKEVANKKEFGNFTYPQQANIPATAPSFVSHISAIRRESVPLRSEHVKEDRRDSSPIIKDSQSCSSLKTHN